MSLAKSIICFFFGHNLGTIYESLPSPLPPGGMLVHRRVLSRLFRLLDVGLFSQGPTSVIRGRGKRKKGNVFEKGLRWEERKTLSAGLCLIPVPTRLILPAWIREETNCLKSRFFFWRFPRLRNKNALQENSLTYFCRHLLNIDYIKR